ncbi:MAG TPA: DUF58 domain-containing protein [Gaiellaceae bacterium]|nr:DUF58 domain-containing protein [Gaiellaceae bacterium]
MSAGTFPLVPRRRVIGLAFGGTRSLRRGTGSDIAGSREYRPGDDVAWIDWAASARLSAARADDEFIVRELFADEAPRVVVLSDHRPSMGIEATPLRPLDKPRALLAAIELIGESARLARSLTGYLDYADGDAYWRPPRSERYAPRGTFDHRAFHAPEDTVSRGLEHLAEHRRDLPTQAFVFVLSDFLVPPEAAVWQRALEHRWELVPVVLQDPVWESSFPDVGGTTVPYADPASGRVVPVHLTRREARRLRAENESRHDGLVALFRSLGIEPVLADSHHQSDLLSAFLRWADLRQLARGALA